MNVGRRPSTPNSGSVHGIRSEDNYFVTGLNQDVSATAGIEDLEILTEHDLVELVRETADDTDTDFCFLKCLETADQQIFIEEYVNFFLHERLISREICVQELTSGKIDILDWQLLMKRCAVSHKGLHYRYRVFRYAYYGENMGIAHVSEYKTDKYVFIISYGDETTSERNLLVDDHHIDKIVGKIKTSKWVNPEVGLGHWFKFVRT